MHQTNRCTSDEQTPRPPSSTHHKKFRPRQRRNSFTIPLAIRCRRVMLFNLSTQFRPTQTRNETQGFSPCLPESGPHSSRQFRANFAADDYTPHSLRKDTKPSAKPCLPMVNTFVPGGSAISSHGQTSF